MLIEEQMNAALSRNPEIILSTYRWRYGKEKDNKEVFLMECPIEELEGFKKYCETMLYNSDKRTPGRFKVLQEVETMANKVKTELMLRDFEENKGLSRSTLLSDINSLLNANGITQDIPFGEIVTEIGETHWRIPTSIVTKGCMKKLGLFDNKKISFNLIIKQGVCATPEEFKQFSVTKNVIKNIKKHLGLPENTTLLVRQDGFTVRELEVALSIQSGIYSNYDTEQLDLLDTKLLPVLMNEIHGHIKMWKSLLDQIEQVIIYKNQKGD